MPQLSTELESLLDDLIGPRKGEFIEQIGQKLPHVIRFNPLKGDLEDLKALFREQGFIFKPVGDRQDICQIEYQPYPIGKSLSHFMGHFYVQDFASMVPPLVLQPEPGDWVLDMSAAPGSKTTQMGTMMNNQGVLLANDIVAKRLRALCKNVERMGMNNTLVYKWHGEQFGNAYYETFDKILLDPACSGLGTVHKNPEVLSWWTPKHCDRLASTQKNMIISAIKALRPGGVLVYSTCTLAPIENEAIVDFAMKEFPMELEEIHVDGLNTWPGLKSFRGETFHPDMDKTVRLYPFDRTTEGFYIARLRKTDSSKAPHPSRKKDPRQMSYLTYKTSPVKKYIDYLQQQFEISEKVFKRYNYLLTSDKIYFCSKSMKEFPIFGKPLQVGTALAKPKTHSTRLNSGGCQIIGQHAQRSVIDIDDPAVLEEFVNRREVDIPVERKGQYIVRYKNCVVGYGIGDNGRLKSQFPKGEWPFKVIPDPAP